MVWILLNEFGIVVFTWKRKKQFELNKGFKYDSDKCVLQMNGDLNFGLSTEKAFQSITLSLTILLL